MDMTKLAGVETGIDRFSTIDGAIGFVIIVVAIIVILASIGNSN